MLFSMEKVRKHVVLTLALVLMIALFSGCGTSNEPTPDPTSTVNTSEETSATASAQVNEKLGGLTLPIVKEPITLKYYYNMDSAFASVGLQSINDVEGTKELEKKTGIHMEFIHPPESTESEFFSTMIASGDYPDIIETLWERDGGAKQFLTDGVIIPLKDQIEQYAPNISKVLKENPNIYREISTADGELYCFPDAINLDVKTSLWYGMMMREDWLQKLNLKVPETIQELHDVLTAFKEKDPNGNNKQDEIPFACKGLYGLTNLIYAWGMADDFYVVDGKVQYPALQPEYKDYLTTLSNWYKEKLIDPDFATTDEDQQLAKLTNNQVGTVIRGVGIIDTVKQAVPDSVQVGISYPKAPDGNVYNFHSQAGRSFSGWGVAITSKNKYVRETVQYLDYGYSEEGNLLYNFGLEGKSYNMVDGKPKYTESLTKNPKYDLLTALALYARGAAPGPYVADVNKWYQLFSLPEQTRTLDTWAKASTKRNLPPIELTAEENDDILSADNEVYNYRAEMELKVILGVEPVNKIDTIVQTLKDLGVEKCLEVRQKAYDRYMIKK